MAASACPLRFQPVSLAGGRLRAAHRRAAVVAWQPPSRSMGGLLFLRGVGSLRAVISAPPMCRAGWSRSPDGWCRGWLLSGGDLKSPRAYRPAPRKRGACAADERRRTHDATPAAPSTASPGAHCCAYAPGNAPPAADFSECAPCGHWPAGHTPRNLTGSAACLPSAYGFATRRPRRGLCASRGTTGLHPIPPPFPIRGRERGVTTAAAGNGPPGTAARASKRSTPTPERTPKHTGRAPRPKAPGNSPLTNCPPLWYSCPRGVASAAAASAALQHLQGSPGSAKARKVSSAFRAFILPPHCPPARPSPHPMRLTQQNLIILLRLPGVE